MSFFYGEFFFSGEESRKKRTIPDNGEETANISDSPPNKRGRIPRHDAEEQDAEYVIPPFHTRPKIIIMITNINRQIDSASRH